jgi:hypothetical protein
MHALEFTLYPHNFQYLKPDYLLKAVERNASLRTVLAWMTFGDQCVDRDWLDDEDDRMKLRSYMARNEFLGQWIENPAFVPRAAWPDFLAVAQPTGPDTVLRIVQGLSNQPVSWFEGA